MHKTGHSVSKDVCVCERVHRCEREGRGRRPEHIKLNVSTLYLSSPLPHTHTHILFPSFFPAPPPPPLPNLYKAVPRSKFCRVSTVYLS